MSVAKQNRRKLFPYIITVFLASAIASPAFTMSLDELGWDFSRSGIEVFRQNGPNSEIARYVVVPEGIEEIRLGGDFLLITIGRSDDPENTLSESAIRNFTAGLENTGAEIQHTSFVNLGIRLFYRAAFIKLDADKSIVYGVSHLTPEDEFLFSTIEISPKEYPQSGSFGDEVLRSIVDTEDDSVESSSNSKTR